MREAIVRAWCDACDAAGDRTPGTEVVVVALGSTGFRELDLCTEHVAALVEPVLALITSHGAPTKAPSKAASAERHACEVCGHVVGTGSGLRDHVRRKHPEVIAAEPLAFPCPDCERAFAHPQGLGAHRARAHGYVGARKAG